METGDSDGIDVESGGGAPSGGDTDGQSDGSGAGADGGGRVAVPLQSI